MSLSQSCARFPTHSDDLVCSTHSEAWFTTHSEAWFTTHSDDLVCSTQSDILDFPTQFDTWFPTPEPDQQPLEPEAKSKPEFEQEPRPEPEPEQEPEQDILEMDLAHEVVRLIPYVSRGCMSPLDLRTIYNMMPLQIHLHTVKVHSELAAVLQRLDLNSEPIHTIGPLGWAISTSCPTCIFLCEQNGACPQKGRSDFLKLCHL